MQVQHSNDLWKRMIEKHLGTATTWIPAAEDEVWEKQEN